MKLRGLSTILVIKYCYLFNMRLFKATIILITVSVLFQTCKEEPEETIPFFDGQRIESLFISANTGSKTANDSLSGFIDVSIPLPPPFNLLFLDSIEVGRKKFYALLVEFDNPVFNTFTVYRSDGKIYIVDRSLNGFLKLAKSADGGHNFFKVEENFLSKDSIKLGRVSIYTFLTDSVCLTFRSFISLSTGNTSMRSELKTILPDSIVVMNSYNINGKESWESDVFSFDNNSLTYISNLNSFNSKVMDFIRSYKSAGKNPSITDKISALKSTGVQTSIDSVNRYNNYKDRTNRFSIFIPEGWRFIRNVKPTITLKKENTGTRIYNKEINASFMVIKIGENESVETYLNTKLDKEMQGHYNVKFIDKIEAGENYYRFFEISCVSLKYLIIFECPIKAYEKNKQVFEDMISSFGIDC